MAHETSLLTLHDVIREFAMERHPVAGWYAPHYSDGELLGRPKLSSIYYLLTEDEPIALHKSDAIEVWHYYMGAPAEFVVSNGSQMTMTSVLGVELDRGMKPQVAVPAYLWQSRRCLGEWTLLGCTATPGFSPRATFTIDAVG